MCMRAKARCLTSTFSNWFRHSSTEIAAGFVSSSCFICPNTILARSLRSSRVFTAAIARFIILLRIVSPRPPASNVLVGKCSYRALTKPYRCRNLSPWIRPSTRVTSSRSAIRIWNQLANIYFLGKIAIHLKKGNMISGDKYVDFSDPKKF